MSNKYLNLSLAVKCPSRAAKSVIISLANRADENGFTWMSNERIANQQQMSLRSVSQGKKELRQAGIIQKAVFGNQKGILIDIERLQQMLPKVQILHLEGETVSANVAKENANAAKKSAVFAPYTSVNINKHQKEDTLSSIQENDENPSDEISKSDWDDIPDFLKPDPPEEKPKPAPKPKSKQPNPRKGAHRLPSDWQVTPELAQYAVGLNLDPETTAEDFREHFTNCTTSKALKKDWGMAFKRWCRNEVKFASQRKQRTQVPINQPQQPRMTQTQKNRADTRKLLKARFSKLRATEQPAEPRPERPKQLVIEAA